MLHYVLGRAFGLCMTLVVSSFAVFFLLEVLPGDAATVALGVQGDEQSLHALREQMGLHKPLFVRYGEWLAGFIRADFGYSQTYGLPVRDIIAERLSVSLALALVSILLIFMLGLPLGVFAAGFSGGGFDRFLCTLAAVFLAVPRFWLGIVFVLIFSVALGWLPSGGFPGWEQGVLAVAKSFILPATALVPFQWAVLFRIVRSAMLEILTRPFLLTARAKGVSYSGTLFRHGFLNALVPIFALMGMQFSVTIAGAVVIENVFYLPGLGRLIFQSVVQRDFVVLRNIVMLVIVAVILVNFLVDVLTAFADPRFRQTLKGHSL